MQELKNIPMHFVCTHSQAKEEIEKHDHFWVSNCGCRESNLKGCARSRLDLCLMFNPLDPGSGTGKHEVDVTVVQGILQEAENKHLVTRPFRDDTRTHTDGFCFCCDDCCGYFLHEDEFCDKGDLIAVTDHDNCTGCGDCVDVCSFKAREMVCSLLQYKQENCYGCGLCVDICPEKIIEMKERLS
jgi:Pyruvate/2-oxoacid:ferredoxin oxidoreductase delta subunit